MEEKLRSTFGFWLFSFVVLFLLIGGYFFTKKMIEQPQSNMEDKPSGINLKIDKSKDYIYYINEEELSSDAEIDYKDVIINLTTQEVLTEGLKKENERFKENIQYIKDQNLVSNDIVRYDNNGIYALTFRTYKDYEYENYVSLIVDEYNYSCFDNITFNKSRAYTFNTSTGDALQYEELLNIFKLSMDDVKDSVRNYLKNKKSGTINIDETINNLNVDNLFINEFGRLSITYLVKTNQTDYNEITEVTK